MRWKEYDEDTVVHRQKENNGLKQSTVIQPNLDVHVDNSKTYVQFGGPCLPDSTKQKVYAAMNDSGYKLGNMIAYIFFGFSAFMFGGLFINSLLSIITKLITGLQFTDIMEMMSFVTTCMMLVISIILGYFISYRVLWKKLCMANKNMIKAFQEDKYEIIAESKIIDKHTSSYDRSSTSFYVELETGGRYQAMFSSQYYKMKLGDEVYAIKINGLTQVILK